MRQREREQVSGHDAEALDTASGVGGYPPVEESKPMHDPGAEACATWRDYAWAGLALIAAAGFVSLVADAGLLVGALLLLPGLWVVAGAWRRTVWGCPFSHAADAEAPCPRHQPSLEV